MAISKDQARDIAQGFLELSHELGTYRFTNWGTLKPTQRQQIEDAEWDLLTFSSSFATTAVGIALNDMQADLKNINDATAKAKKAIKTVGVVKDVLKVVTALVILGGAIASQNPTAIASAATDGIKVVQSVLNPAGG